MFENREKPDRMQDNLLDVIDHSDTAHQVTENNTECSLFVNDRLLYDGSDRANDERGCKREMLLSELKSLEFESRVAMEEENFAEIQLEAAIGRSFALETMADKVARAQKKKRNLEKAQREYKLAMKDIEGENWDKTVSMLEDLG